MTNSFNKYSSIVPDFCPDIYQVPDVISAKRLCKMKPETFNKEKLICNWQNPTLSFLSWDTETDLNCWEFALSSATGFSSLLPNPFPILQGILSSSIIFYQVLSCMKIPVLPSFIIIHSSISLPVWYIFTFLTYCKLRTCSTSFSFWFYSSDFHSLHYYECLIKEGGGGDWQDFYQGFGIKWHQILKTCPFFKLSIGKCIPDLYQFFKNCLILSCSLYQIAKTGTIAYTKSWKLISFLTRQSWKWLPDTQGGGWLTSWRYRYLAQIL